MALSAQFNKMYGVLRHKYMNGSGEVIDVGNNGGVADDEGNTLLQQDETELVPSAQVVAISARSTLFSAANATDQEIVLPSASEAAKFRVGDTINVVNVSAQQTRQVEVVKAVKGQKLLLNAAIGAAFDADSHVVRFASTGVDGVSQDVTDASAGLQYVGMGDMAAFLNELQASVSHAGIPTGAAPADDATTQFSTIVTTLDNVDLANSLDGDIVVFSDIIIAGGAADTEFDGATAVIQSHTTGNNVTITVGDIRHADGTSLGDKFPVSATKANGTVVSLTTNTGTDLEIRASVCDPFIAAMMGPDHPLSGTGRAATDGGSSFGMGENSNTPGAVTLFLNGLFAFIMKYDRDTTGGALSEIIPMDTEEALLGHMINYRTDQGIRVRLAADAVDTATTIVVEMDNAINDIPLPLSGNVRILTNTGVGNTEGSSGVGVIPSATTTFSYTRLKRSGTLTIDAITSAVSEGDIVELDPSQGRVMNGYSADVTPPNLMVLLEKSWRVANDYATTTGVDSTAEIPSLN